MYLALSKKDTQTCAHAYMCVCVCVFVCVCVCVSPAVELLSITHVGLHPGVPCVPLNGICSGLPQ